MTAAISAACSFARGTTADQARGEARTLVVERDRFAWVAFNEIAVRVPATAAGDVSRYSLIMIAIVLIVSGRGQA
jgi:hypothetical protein